MASSRRHISILDSVLPGASVTIASRFRSVSPSDIPYRILSSICAFRCFNPFVIVRAQISFHKFCPITACFVASVGFVRPYAAPSRIRESPVDSEFYGARRTTVLFGAPLRPRYREMHLDWRPPSDNYSRGERFDGHSCCPQLGISKRISEI